VALRIDYSINSINFPLLSSLPSIRSSQAVESHTLYLNLLKENYIWILHLLSYVIINHYLIFRENRPLLKIQTHVEQIISVTVSLHMSSYLTSSCFHRAGSANYFISSFLSSMDQTNTYDALGPH